MQRILITGGTGYLGAELIQRARAGGWDVGGQGGVMAQTHAEGDGGSQDVVGADLFGFAQGCKVFEGGPARRLGAG